MKTFRKTLSTFLAALMIVCAMSALTVAFADTPALLHDKAFEFILIGEEGAETAKIVKLNQKAGSSILLPAAVTPEEDPTNTYVVTEVAENVFSPDANNPRLALENDITEVTVNWNGVSDTEGYDTFINAYKDSFKNVDTVTVFRYSLSPKAFIAAVKEDAAAALADRGITTAEELVDYIASRYYKYTTAICDALAMKTVQGYLPVSEAAAAADEAASASNGILYTSSITGFYQDCADALGVDSIPNTLLVVPPARTKVVIESGTARISGYAFANRTADAFGVVEELGIPESVKTFGKGTYVAAGDTEAAEHNTFDTATVKAVEIRSKEFIAIMASGLIKESDPIDVYAYENFAFRETVLNANENNTFNELTPSRIEQATGIFEKLSEIFKKIVEFFRALLERIRG